MPHAVTGVTNPDGLISTSDQRLSYTSFNKADSIIQNNYIYTLKYGHQDQRTISKLFSNGTLQKTVYYVGAFEKEIIAGIPYPKNIHYIYGGDGLAAIYTTQSSNSDMYYVHKDHLGSIDKITNSTKIVVQKTSFDAWGRRRNPDNWTYSNIPSTIFSRGYTGHEHLDQFDLINMNGRMYDPILGRFLSADNFVQNPYFSQSFNRYSYVSNNPLTFSDPSGYLPQGVNFWSLVDDLWNRAGKNGGAGWSAGGGFWSSDFSEYGILTGYSFYEVPRYSVSASGGSIGIAHRGLLHQKWQFVPIRLPKFSIHFLGTETRWGPIYSFGGFNGEYTTIPKVNFLAGNAEYQLAYAFAYVAYYGRDQNISSGDLFDFKSLNRATKQNGGSFGSFLPTRAGQVGNVKFVFSADENSIAENVVYYSIGRKTNPNTASLYNKSINEAWFSESLTSQYSAYSLRLEGEEENIMTLYFSNYKELMKWVNFIKKPYNGF